MLRIACVANSFEECKRFAQYKFKDKIKEYRATFGYFILDNDDEIYLCYDEGFRDRYLSMEYDAFIIAPQYKSLADVIRYRSER